MNNTAVNIRVYVSYGVHMQKHLYVEVELLGHRVCHMFNFR